MKTYIIPFVISLFAFSLCFILLNSYKITPTEIGLELDAIVTSDDVFQLFYQQQGMKWFSEEQSIRASVSGSEKSQKIRFNLPLDKPIVNLRIDIGNNRKQSAIEMKDVKLKTFKKSITYNINDDFKPNTHINFEERKIKTQVVNNAYDPYFIANFNVKGAIEDLSKEEPVFDKIVIILLSFIISLTLFVVFSYQKINVENLYSNLFIFVFIILLIAPFISEKIGLDLESSLQEKRELAPKPEFKFNEAYPQEYEKYYNDNFGLRTLFVNWNSKIKLDIFKASPNPELAMFGKDGFLFYNSKVDAVYGSYSNTNTTTIQNLERAYKKQVSLKDTFTKKNIKYIVGFFPNKHSIYKEKLPLSMNLQIQNDTSLASQLVLYFKERGFPIVDVTNDMLKAKNEQQLYFKFDTHWNAYGAYVGYRSFFKQTFDELHIVPFDTTYFDIQYKEKSTGDLTDIIGVKEIEAYSERTPIFNLKNKSIGYKSVSSEGYPAKTLITINENCGNKNTVLIFRDSFTTALIPYLSLHYYKVVYIWAHVIDMDLVEKVHPDIVMSLYIERYFSRILK